jgi:hypothetical protein
MNVSLSGSRRLDSVGGAAGRSRAPRSCSSIRRFRSAAVLLGPARYASGVPACSPRVPAHGGDLESRAWDVLVPAGQTAVATLNFRTADARPWPDTSYGVTFLADPRLVSGQSGTLAAPLRVRASGPAVRGPRAVHIRLRSRPQSDLPSTHDPSVRRGRSVAIGGSTSPLLRKTRITVTVTGPLDTRLTPRTRRITVRSDHRGRFVLRHLRLGPRGRYEVGASARGDGRRVVGDYTCPLGFRVR